MSWRTEWHAIFGRITSLLDAGRFFAEILKVYASDMYGGASLLMNNAPEIFHSLDVFNSTYSATLPEPAAQRLREFIKVHRAKFESAPEARDALSDSAISSYRTSSVSI